MDSSLHSAAVSVPGSATTAVASGSGFDLRHPWRSAGADLDAAYWEAVRLHRAGHTRWFRFRRSADIR
ncbi:hypothetical protein MTQ13_11130 [Streptomyces sp. XM4011]|uniref:hypothetical protein n=1 Tax=Streptomyces sp. XM4011 TaxID=2929780 RepID=UPI001FF76DD0|nr:hypothetical protein [Streptomyces sp. XM4011]MCK1814828.1 hypothetical protein [Streptomyces sp. XM4011]